MMDPVTGVLDCQNARYGVHVFDLAYMLNWLDESTQEACMNVYKESLRKLGRSETHTRRQNEVLPVLFRCRRVTFCSEDKEREIHRAVLDKLVRLLDRTRTDPQ